MNKPIKADICVIGAGSGGLSVAAGAAQMGAKTVLIERGAMGGDCLNTGCVPSKALLAAAHRAQSARDAAPFGVAAGEVKVDYARTMAHVREVIDGIAPHDSVERFEGLGVTVLQGEACFSGPRQVEVGDQSVSARRFVIATGSRPAIPAIDGLDHVPYLTNETLFEETECPSHLIIVGAGPVGLEMAQAHKRLGASVTVLEAGRALPKEDPALAEVVLTRLRREGVEILEGVSISSVSGTRGALTISYRRQGGQRDVSGSHLLIATGRRPNTESLKLEMAEVAVGPDGITVDDRMRTTNAKIYAIGDVATGPNFTHAASYQAGLVLRNALFRVPAKADYSAFPRVTYTDPELAQVGLTETEAQEQGHKKLEIVSWPFEENDRARAERDTDGLIRLVVAGNGRILGGGIAGPHAGELIASIGFAIQSKKKIIDLSAFVLAYPTLSEVIKRSAGSYYTPKLFSKKTRAAVKFLSFFG